MFSCLWEAAMMGETRSERSWLQSQPGPVPGTQSLCPSACVCLSERPEKAQYVKTICVNQHFSAGASATSKILRNFDWVYVVCYWFVKCEWFRNLPSPFRLCSGTRASPLQESTRRDGTASLPRWTVRTEVSVPTFVSPTLMPTQGLKSGKRRWANKPGHYSKVTDGYSPRASEENYTLKLITGSSLLQNRA